MTDAAELDPGYQRFDCTGGDPEVLDCAAEAARAAVQQGRCIVFPTDTVYGIGADAFSPEAVQGLLDAKIRGRDMPPPVLIADTSLLRALAVGVPEAAKTLVAWYWPGPVTIICQAQPSLRMDLGDTAGTIALRVPNHELAREILRRTGPMAVSSANISGMPAATTCDEAVEQLADRVAVYLDGGPVSVEGTAKPSTIVDFTQVPGGAILRHGALSVQQIRDVCPNVVDLDDDEPAPGAATSAVTGLEESAEGETVDEETVDEGTVDEEWVDQDGVDQGGVDQGGVDQDGVDQAALRPEQQQISEPPAQQARDESSAPGR